MTYQQRQVSIENGIQHEEIPLNQLNSNQDNIHRERIRQIFNRYDQDRNGYLDIVEMKNLIKSHLCDALPNGIATRIMKMGDNDYDGHLNFEEFYKLSLQHEWIVTGYARKYCKMIVPDPHRPATGDTIGHTYYGIESYGSTTNIKSGSIGLTDGQYESSMSCCPPPITMIVFSIIEIITFLYDVIYFDEHKKGNIQQVGLSTRGPAARLFIYNPLARQQAWRFVTYMFVHVGVMHLVSNLVIQIFLGTALELVHSWWRVALVYLAGVAAGSMGTSVSDPRIWLAGASGGVYALITAHIATIILNWREMEYAIIQLVVFLLFCSVDLGQSIFNHITNKNDQVGYIAHLGGAIAGLLVGIGVLRNLQERNWEKKLWWFAITVYFGLMFSAICVHIFVPNYFPKPLRG